MTPTLRKIDKKSKLVMRKQQTDQNSLQPSNGFNYQNNLYQNDSYSPNRNPQFATPSQYQFEGGGRMEGSISDINLKQVNRAQLHD